MLRPALRVLLVVLGVISVVVGVVALFVPVVPTTPFLLLAAFLFDRSSRRFHHWLMTNRFFGRYLTDIRERHGLPLRHKLLTISAMWLSMLVTLTVFVTVWWGRAALVTVGLAVTAYLNRMRTLRDDDEPSAP